MLAGLGAMMPMIMQVVQQLQQQQQQGCDGAQGAQAASAASAARMIPPRCSCKPCSRRRKAANPPHRRRGRV